MDQNGNRTGDAIHAGEEKYRRLFNSIDEGFCLLETVHDAAGRTVDLRFLKFNSGYERLTGQQNVMGKTVHGIARVTERDWIEICDRVARTGEPLRQENFHQATGRWYTAHAARVGGEGSRQIAIVFDDITERKRTEQTQAFLLKLSDALRPLSDPTAIQAAVAGVVMDHFEANRCYYCEIEDNPAVPSPPRCR